MRKTQLFDAANVALNGSNLVEASAGTGKTYSIAILVVRLIIEKKLSVKEILMVTFTKAAVAELEERVRVFVRSAYRVSLGEKIKDEFLASLVNRCPDQEEAKRLLKEAVLFLDETSVLTIHSFCQKTLNEFAFETNQLFGAETLQDTSALLQDEINRFWRKNVTTIHPGLLRHLLEAGLSRETIKQVVKEHLSGKKYFAFDAEMEYLLKTEDHAALIESLQQLRDKEAALRECIVQHVIDHRERLRTISGNNRYAKKALLQLIDTPAEFIDYVAGKRGSAYIPELYPDILQQHDACDDLKTERNDKLNEIIRLINSMAIQDITNGIKAYKQRNNQLSFDDMIVKLHDALVPGNNLQLVKELKKKYKAVFVDEFQDTDRLQYELFQKAFSTGAILFYIGDPKQSIYAWRKADIFTYFKAYEAVDHMYDMNLNYRSSEPMIRAMNAFFKPVESFDTFYFNGAEDAIEYIPVAPPEVSTKGLLYNDTFPATPITVSYLQDTDQIYDAVAAQVIDLLENPTIRLGAPGKLNATTPSDIGILVRSNKQGRKVKKRLARFSIPAVTIGDDKVLQSEEATYLLYLLEAMADISRAGINKALLSPFTGFTIKDILNLDDEKTLELFKKYKLRWEEDGVYTALKDFVADFRVQQSLLQQHSEHGERTIANLYHLVELVHKVQSGKMLSPVELISWLKRGIEGMETEGDEYEQRVENDEAAVKIVTIHKSKGLEYNIVLSPFMDFTEPKKATIFSFRDEASGEYISVEKSTITAEQKIIYSRQAEQEHRRLLYVAITRAVYKCFIYRNMHYKASTLASFTSSLAGVDPSLVGEAPVPGMPQNYRYSRGEQWQRPLEKKAANFSLSHQSWTRMSYTMLASKTALPNKGTGVLHSDAYDQFVFQQLSKGDKTGNLLHAILENINYSTPEKWAEVITAAIMRYAPAQKELYERLLPEMISHTLQASIKAGTLSFRLAEISYSKRLHEFEFDFPVASFPAAMLEELSDDMIRVNVQSSGELEGMMNGKMDLFFEQDDKYFILDWKSNFLGDQIADYAPSALVKAMNEHNYHLQYFIYTVAVKKYLESRLPSFDYERDFGGIIYVFMRGVRTNTGTGIYTVKPPLGKVMFLENLLTAQSHLKVSIIA